MWMANNGNYRELRYFTPWMKHRQVEDHYLPRIIQVITGQVGPRNPQGPDDWELNLTFRPRYLLGMLLLAPWTHA